ncbi:MAG: HlyD family secretion protein [Bacteroidales bacterium]|nr:HlyD family secretion protein [Bacteroidales bacterium]
MNQINHSSDRSSTCESPHPPLRGGLGGLELKSPPVQEVLGRPPRWVIRWGITVIMVVIAVVFVGSYFFKYPDVVSATVEVTTENLPVTLVARATGKLDTLFVSDNEMVEKDRYLAVIENPADFGDVLVLKEALIFFSTETRRAQSFTEKMSYGLAVLRSYGLTLGELQPHYHQFIKSCEDYDYFIQADYYNQKINALRRQIALQQQLQQRTRTQCDLSRQQLATQERLFASDSILYVRNAIALVEYETARSAFLQVQQAYQSTLSSIDNIALTIAQYEQNIFDLQQQSDEKEKELLSSLSGAYEALQSQINQWELQYVFKSAGAGKVSMTRPWQKNQHITAGEALLSIVPEGSAQITGKIMLPAQGAGKVKVGQAVNVKFDGYPYMEFGMVRGKVKNISLVPVATQQGKFTMVEVEFPDNLTTNYGKTLDFSQEMSGTAEIITEDLRLIERFFNPVKALIKR